MSSTMPIFRKTVSAPEMSSGKRLWRGKKSGDAGAVKKKRKKPNGSMMMEWRVKGAEKFAMAKARLEERLSHLTNWISYQFYTFTHPCSPLRRRAARRSKQHSKLGATERRINKEAIARSKSAEKRARALEKRIANDAEHAKLL